MKYQFKIILASSSLRRKQLLEQLGIPFETVNHGEVEAAWRSPKEQVIENALPTVRKVVEQRKT